MPHDIFISYSRHNLEAVKTIMEELESRGFSCWMDLEGIESGSRVFSQHLIDAIDAAPAMLFFLSTDSQTSEWALKEIDYATEEKKHVVLVRFNDDPMTKTFRFDFRRADIIDWRKPAEKAKLLRDLQRWSGQSDSSGKDSPESLYRMGLRYKVGDGVERSLPRAADLFRQSAERGHLAAMNDYGVCLERGQGVRKDIEQAAQWYRKAAESGYAHAQLNLGYCFHRGVGVPEDQEEATRWYRAAAEQGNAWAQCNLGLCYEHGTGVELDEDEARYWYELAAEQGDVTAVKGLDRLSGRHTAVSVACEPFACDDGAAPETIGPDRSDDCFGSVSGDCTQGRINSFLVKDAMGSGAFGKVFRAEDRATGRLSALKILRNGQHGWPDVGRYVRIVEVLERLDPDSRQFARPLRLFQAAADDFVPDGSVKEGDWIVEMALVPGESSDVWARTLDVGAAHWTSAVFDVCKQVATALDKLHRAGVFHRDVSPTNILITRENGETKARLCDFDFSMFRKDTNELISNLNKGGTERVVGTPGYIAPEVLAGHPFLSGSADQYSLACVLYRWLSGRVPFTYDRSVFALESRTDCLETRTFAPVAPQDQIWKDLSSPPKIITCLDRRQNAALGRALSISSASRYSSCAEMVEAVRTGVVFKSREVLRKLFWPF